MLERDGPAGLGIETMSSKIFRSRWSAFAAALARHSRETSSVAAIALAVVAHGASNAAPFQAPDQAVPATASEPQPPGAGDPFERTNRRAFNMEKGFDRALLRPAAMAYRRGLPKPLRLGLAHFASNLGEPEVLVNDALQARPREAGKTLVRFAVNTTLGVGGLVDVAKRAGLPHHDNDFGLTLARYGVAPGPYLFMPFVGPSSVRDASGTVLSIAFNPLTYIAFAGSGAIAAGDAVTSGLEKRGSADPDIKALYAASLDPYAALRSYYLQARESQVRGGVVSVEALPDFDDAPKTVASAQGAAQ